MTTRHLLTMAILAGLAALPGRAADAAEQAGISAAVRGDVRMAAAAVGAVGREIRSGEQIFIGDRIVAGPQAGMQVLLLDQTVFTIGPDSDITIDSFVYDPDTSAGKVAASVRRGVFRFISGKVARDNPENMTVKIGSATIGVRGTMVAGRLDGDRAEVMLLGPGPADNSGARRGRITVSNAAGVVEISRPGFGTVLPGVTEPPSLPFRFPPDLSGAILGAIGHIAAPPGGASPPPVPVPSGQGGATVVGNQAAAEAGLLAATSLGLTDQAETVATLAGETLLTTRVNDLTSFDQLRLLTGTGTYSQTSVPLETIVTSPGNSRTGSYDFSLTVDFTNRTYSYSVSYGILNLTPFGGSGFTAFFNGGPTSYASAGGTTLFAETVGSDQIKVQLRNIDGTIAKAAEHSVVLSGLKGSGTAYR